MSVSTDPGDLPEVLRATPQPLVGFVGLNPEASAQHTRVWQSFTSNRGPDRHAFTFLPLDLETVELPVAKPARQTYEWLVPRGILKRNWATKHLSVLPSVVVVFADMDWAEPDTNRVVATVARVRQLLAGRLTKLVVVLLQEDSSSPGDSVMTALCSQCGVSGRAIFPLRLGPGEDLTARVTQLEAAVQELAQNYYHGQIKTVRGHRDQLNRTTHLQLLVRHGFKLGFLNELKMDHHAAYKSYTAAYQLLLELRLTEHSAPEIRTVAGFISYKICRLAFRLNLPRDAISQFRKHMDQFRLALGPQQLSWEHAAWQAGQAAAFGRLFSEAHLAGQTAVQTQHPGLYFQLAAEYAISRRKLADSLCSAVSSYPAPDPLATTPQALEFYGQRAWRPGKQEAPDQAKEKEGTEALQYRERTRTKHSQMILQLLRLAVEQFDKFRSPRMKNRLTLQMAEEEMAEGEYSAALATLLPCRMEYRAEAWPALLSTLLGSALKCAFLTSRLAEYVTLGLELAGLQGGSLEEEARVWGNLLLVLEAGRPPLPEPSLTGKSERASVAGATKAWLRLLAEGPGESQEVDVTDFPSCLAVTLTLPEEVVAGEELLVRVTICNRSSVAEPALTIGAVRACFSEGGEDYSEQCCSLELGAVAGGESLVREWRLVAGAGAAGGELRVARLEVAVGSSPSRVTLVMRPPAARVGEESVMEHRREELVQRWSCRVAPRPSLVQLEVGQEPPVLVGEWFPLSLHLTNREAATATNLSVTAWLRDSADPLVGDTTLLSVAPREPPSPNPSSPAPTLELLPGDLEPGAQDTTRLYLRASTVGPRVLLLQLRYSVAGLPAQLQHSLELAVMDPFSLSSCFLSQALEETTTATTDELFCVSVSLSSASPHPLHIVTSSLESRPPLAPRSQPTNSLAGSSLAGLATVEQLFPLLVPAAGLLAELDTQTLHTGKFLLNWRRDGSPAEVVNTTEFSLPTIALSRAVLFAECRLPASATLRTPLQAVYTLHNRTSELQEYTVATEPSEAFMFSGPKQVRVKLFPQSSYTLGHIFYPLVCGPSPLPRLRITAAESGSGVGAQEALERLLPTQLLVLPRERREREAVLPLQGVTVTPAVVIPNLPFKKKVVRG